LKIDEVTDLERAVLEMFRSGHTPKRMPPFDADSELPGTKRRGEYYAWLTGLAPGSRVFRYGCDRYFNPLKKMPRTIRPKVKRPRKYPWHLTPYMFGNHPDRCQCIACGGLGRRQS
jgi:hypothetical protein